MTQKKLIGPFSQIVTMSGLAHRGHLDDEELYIIKNGGIVVSDGVIVEIGNFSELKNMGYSIIDIPSPSVALPGLIDSHTHLCYAGSRSHEYAKRLSGRTYQEIAAHGGGIRYTVQKTREASQEELEELMIHRAKSLLRIGVTTCEVKSGYGLNVKDEIKMLQAIQEASNKQPLSMIPTCLAAHMKPDEFTHNEEYLSFLIEVLLPHVKEKELSKRIDIFVEKGAFSVDEARKYLIAARNLGFQITLHADQFSRGGAQLAAELGAVSAEHLEVSSREDGEALSRANVTPIVLPGASLGLGIGFAPAKMLLDCGLPLVIASDLNPGSAPMGNLLVQAALLSAYQKLTMAETLAAITIRAARVLEQYDRGELAKDKRADIVVFPTENFMDILYYQGSMTPSMAFVKGENIYG